jgi:adenine phosphoribosyltransferase
MGVGFVPVRKLGKLPYRSIAESYALEYGEATLEIHEDAIKPHERVLIVDDLLATGGTVAATCNLVERLGGQVSVIGTLIELTFLPGRKALGKRPYYSFLKY